MAKKLFGIDYIGGAKYVSTLVRNHLEGWAAGFLWDIDGFGKANRAINRLAKSGKAPRIRVHLMWKDNHSFSERDISVCVQRAKELAKIIAKYPGIEWYVSPFLEPRRPKKSVYERVIADTKAVLPTGVKMVASSLEGSKIKGAITEMHHGGWKSNVSGETIFSFDGIECVDSDVEKWKKRAQSATTFYFWRYTFNGKFGPKDKRKRPQRTSYPSSKDILSVVPLAERKGKTRLPRGWIYKTHAESYHPSNPRSNKPVWIIGTKADRIELRAKGKVVAVAKYEKPYSHGSGHIYRMSKWGFEIAQDVLKLKRRANVNVFVAGKKQGRINPSFREGKYLS